MQDVSDVGGISVDEQVQAIVTGLTQIKNIGHDIVQILRGVVSTKAQDRAAEVTFYRICLMVTTLSNLRDYGDFQSAQQGARAIFELLIDLRLLLADEAAAQKFHDFVEVERFRTASLLLDFLDANPSVDSSRYATEIAFVKDVARRQQVESLCVKQWGNSKKNGTPIYPKHWSGMDMAQRVSRVGVKYAEMYRARYPLNSWYIHAGATGFASISTENFKRVFGIALLWSHQMSSEACELIANHFQLFVAESAIRERLKDATFAPGRVAYSIAQQG